MALVFCFKDQPTEDAKHCSDSVCLIARASLTGCLQFGWYKVGDHRLRLVQEQV